MNKECRESMKIAKLGINQIEELLSTFEAAADEGSQITADYDISLTATSSTHRIEVTVFQEVAD